MSTATLVPVASALLHARALALVTAARFLLPRRGTAATLRRLGPPPRERGPVDTDAALAAVQRASRLAGGACLPQSVALAALLRRDGGAPVLVVGCQRYEDRTWGAHAWVRLDGRVLDPDPCGEHADLAWYRSANDWQPGSPGELGRGIERGA
jgi:hypothetical protein